MTQSKFFVGYVGIGLLTVAGLFWSVFGSPPEPTLIFNNTMFEIDKQDIRNFEDYIGVSIWLKRGISQGPVMNITNEYSPDNSLGVLCADTREFVSKVIAPQYTLEQLAWLKLYEPNRNGDAENSEPQFISFDGESCRLLDQFALPAPQQDWLFYGSTPDGYAAKSVRNGFPETEIRAMSLLFTWEGEGDIDYSRFDFQKACEVVISYSPYWIEKNLARYGTVIFDMTLTELIDGVEPDQLPYVQKSYLASQSGCEPTLEIAE